MLGKFWSDLCILCRFRSINIKLSLSIDGAWKFHLRNTVTRMLLFSINKITFARNCDIKIIKYMNSLLNVSFKWKINDLSDYRKTISSDSIHISTQRLRNFNWRFEAKATALLYGVRVFKCILMHAFLVWDHIYCLSCVLIAWQKAHTHIYPNILI